MLSPVRVNPRRPVAVAAALLVLAGLAALAYALAGGALAAALGRRFAGPLGALGQGLIGDPVAFVHGRLREAVVLGVFALACVALDLALWPRFAAAARRNVGLWAVGAALVFVQLNGLAAVASRTAVFWLATWQGEDDSYPTTPFNIKRLLAAESGARRHVVLVGSSQVAAQVEESQIARALGDSVRVTELGYVGAEPFDFLLIQPTYAGLHPDAVVVYLSEISFYRGVVGMRYVPFMGAGGQRDFAALGGRRLTSPGLGDARLYARFARALPLYAIRDPLVRRVLGPEVADIAQFNYDVDLIADLEERAVAMAPSFTAVDAPSVAFQKDALLTFIRRSAAAGTRVVLLAGRISPRIERRLNPALRADFLAYLRALDAREPNVDLVDETALPHPPAEDYRDLTHVTEEEKVRGTREMLPALVPPLRAALARPRTAR